MLPAVYELPEGPTICASPQMKFCESPIKIDPNTPEKDAIFEGKE